MRHLLWRKAASAAAIDDPSDLLVDWLSRFSAAYAKHVHGAALGALDLSFPKLPQLAAFADGCFQIALLARGSVLGAAPLEDAHKSLSAFMAALQRLAANAVRNDGELAVALARFREAAMKASSRCDQ